MAWFKCTPMFLIRGYTGITLVKFAALSYIMFKNGDYDLSFIFGITVVILIALLSLIAIFPPEETKLWVSLYSSAPRAPRAPRIKNFIKDVPYCCEKFLTLLLKFTHLVLIGAVVCMMYASVKNIIHLIVTDDMELVVQQDSVIRVLVCLCLSSWMSAFTILLGLNHPHHE